MVDCKRDVWYHTADFWRFALIAAQLEQNILISGLYPVRLSL